MWARTKTAILIIHGVGQQSTFEPLDSFVRGLLGALENANRGAKIEASHRVRKQKDWVASCISLVKDGDERTSIDCFEYYWAHHTQRQVTPGDVFDWLIETGKGARTYYDDNDEIVATYERDPKGPFGKSVLTRGKVRFDKYWYLKEIGIGFLFLRPLILLLGYASNLHPVGQAIRAGLKGVLAVARPVLVDYVGDIVVYTASDMKSKHFEVRQRILDGAVANVRWLLESTEPEYGAIVVAGHSLGSVIAYDALNRINNIVNVDKELAPKVPRLKGLVTFGSPLDKVAFFFRARVKKDKYIKRQIVAQLIGFKAKNLSPGWVPEHKLVNKIAGQLSHVRWINFWGEKDPISGPLDFYDVAKGDNRPLDLGKRWGFAAHGEYWDKQSGMYSDIVRDILA